MSAHAATASIASTASHGGKKDYSTICLIAGIVFVFLSFVGLFMGAQAEDARPFLGVLLGAAFWLSICIGALFFVMLAYVFDAGWSVVVRRQAEFVIGSFKWLALIIIPLVVLAIFNADNNAYPWKWLSYDRYTASGHLVGHDPLFLAKEAYLNSARFLGFVVLYFAIWIGVSEALRYHSRKMDSDGDLRHTRACRKISAFGIIASAFATTFAAIDLFKSLDYHWFSTMYGVWFFAASIRAGTALLIILCFYAAHKGWLKGYYKPAHSYLLGCMLLAFTVFWAYISFSQYFLIYSANIPEETFWYNIREINADGAKNSWWWVSMGLIFAHFFVPFLYLLWYNNKFGMRIVIIAAWTLTFHLLDLYWNIVPTKKFDAATGEATIRQFYVHWVDITTIIGVGALVLWVLLSSAKRTKAIPTRDPRILESLNAHE